MPSNSNFFTLLFADDTTLEDKDSDLDKLTQKCNSNLTLAAKWFQANRLTLNAKKTKCMVFGPNGNCAPLPFPLKIAGVEIDRIGNRFLTKSLKLAGVHLDDNLNWNEQAAHVRSKLSKTNYELARAKRCLSSNIKNGL